MTLLNNFFSNLPFMNEERADLLISSFWPMFEATLIGTIPLALISFFAGLLLAVGVAIIRTMPSQSAFHRLLVGLT